ncbi:MAG TPA: DUF58 domain-containing protein [Terriglobales bacterium]|nr:DUF58 domain-containing protein [Terriglobales bacterium]
MPDSAKSVSPPSVARRLASAIHPGIPEVWMRFLLAIAGLGLAFAAALFSTVARDSGNLWATLVFAAGALMLAIVVGLTTVPYLARRVVGERLKDAFDYEVTRVGIFYVAAVLLIGIAALNTGNNLLYIVVSAMLAAILVSGIASAMTLRHLQLDVRLPEHVFAGRGVQGRIRLRNRRRCLPSFSINVLSLKKNKPGMRWRWVPETFGFPPGRRAAEQWLKLPDRKLRRVAENAPPPQLFEGSAHFPYLPPGSELAADIDLHFSRRGRYRQEGFGLATRFPFAFLTRTRRIALRREIVVYPPVEPADELFAALPMITGEFETFVRGRGADLYRIREYLPQDSARHVDWKATAKSGALKVREFTREDERKLRIVFDNPGPGVVSTENYEKAVAVVASLGWHFAQENAEVSFLAPAYQGAADVYEFLAYLALVEAKAAPSVIENFPLSDHYNIIITARSRGTIPTALWDHSYFWFIGETLPPGKADPGRDRRPE